MNSPRTFAPRTHNVQRWGLNETLTRVVLVHLYDNKACSGGPLHRAEGIIIATGATIWRYVSHAEAQKWGWV